MTGVLLHVGGWFRRTDVLTSILAALLSTVIAITVLGMWDFRWDVPLVYSGDGLATAAHIKTVLETGWYEWQPRLGAPFGQRYHDFPTADNLHFLVALALGAVLPSWGAVMNVHFLLGFPLAAIAAVWFFRRVGISPALTTVLAVLFAIAPYHFARGEAHLFLSWYWVIPLGLGLVWSILRSEPLWGAREGMPRGLRHAFGRTGATTAILVIVASDSAYYAVFILLLGGIAALAALALGGGWRRFGGAVSAATLTIAVMLANMLPDLLFRLVNGANPEALARTPVESEVYALKLAQLLLPAPGHRFAPFAYLREQYDLHYPLVSESPALGILGALGLVILVIASFIALAAAARGRGVQRDSTIAILAGLGFLALLGFVFSTVGGLSTLISFVTTSLRAWNRISIVLAALALAGLGIALGALLRRVTRSARLGVAVVPTLAVVLLVIGVWDQTPALDPSARAATVASFDSDARFTAELEGQLAEGALVFALPYIDFPESPQVGGTQDSDQFRMFLHSTDLRFSGGGIRGREDIESLAEVGAMPARQFVEAASELGFAGVIVDSRGYDNLDDILGVTGTEPIESSDSRFTWIPFD